MLYAVLPTPSWKHLHTLSVVPWHILWCKSPFCFNPVLLFLQCVRGLQCFFKAGGNLEFPRMWFVFCSPISPIQGLSLLQQCYLTQHCKKTNRWSDRVIERRGRDWLLLNTKHQRGNKPPSWCHHLPLIWRSLFGFADVLVDFLCFGARMHY